MNTQNAKRILDTIKLLEQDQLFFRASEQSFPITAPRFSEIDDCINARVERLNAVKVTNGVPRNVRFRFIKRVANKLIRTFSMQQVTFNEADVDLEWAQNRKLEILSEQCILQHAKLRDGEMIFNSKLEELSLHIIKLEEEIKILKSKLGV